MQRSYSISYEIPLITHACYAIVDPISLYLKVFFFGKRWKVLMWVELEVRIVAALRSALDKRKTLLRQIRFVPLPLV